MFRRLFVAVCVVLLALWVGGFLSTPPEAPVLQDGWWGHGARQPYTDVSVRPFVVDIPEIALRDLQRRLGKTRMGDSLEDADFYYGFQVGAMQKVLSYWKKTFDWKKQEKLLNQFPQYKTTIEGIEVHFLRVPPKNKGVSRPLLMVHGWPGSIWEFYKILPILSEQGFEVVCPSIPGYGFSEQPHQKGFDPSDASRIFHKLMMRLKLQKYYVQGGDWGALITTIIAQAYPKHVSGAHTNLCVASKFSVMGTLKTILGAFYPSFYLSQEQLDKGFRVPSFSRLLAESGYFHIQSTKPDTVGFGLNDSPVGLAAYILEKYSTWTNASYVNRLDGGLTEKFTLDELLTNVMIYWFSGHVEASMRLYKENINSEIVQEFGPVPVSVPSAVANFPAELFISTESTAAEKYLKLIQYSNMPRGGHFAAFEEPQLLAKDIILFVEKVEQLPDKTK